MPSLSHSNILAYVTSISNFEADSQTSQAMS